MSRLVIKSDASRRRVADSFTIEQTSRAGKIERRPLERDAAGDGVRLPGVVLAERLLEGCKAVNVGAKS